MGIYLRASFSACVIGFLTEEVGGVLSGGFPGVMKRSVPSSSSLNSPAGHTTCVTETDMQRERERPVSWGGVS